jgi:hypothetical protein
VSLNTKSRRHCLGDLLRISDLLELLARTICRQRRSWLSLSGSTGGVSLYYTVASRRGAVRTSLLAFLAHNTGTCMQSWAHTAAQWGEDSHPFLTINFSPISHPSSSSTAVLYMLTYQQPIELFFVVSRLKINSYPLGCSTQFSLVLLMIGTKCRQN